MEKEQVFNADKWLLDNTDKWENGGEGFKFLVPEEEVPPEVLERVKEMKGEEDITNSIHKVFNAMK